MSGYVTLAPFASIVLPGSNIASTQRATGIVLLAPLKSLLSNEDNEHYMGYLVLQTSNNKEFQIIDGQQRLTTMSLLILATLKCLKELVDSGIDPENNIKILGFFL